MRIVSLLPSATEILFALGLGEQVVGVSHECDFPAEARNRRVVIHSRIPKDASPAEIDRLVREYVERGESVYSVDGEVLQELNPDLIVTQDLCHVCAASPDDLAGVLARFDLSPQVLCLNPQDLRDVWRDILWVGEETARGTNAEKLLECIGERLGRVEAQVAATEGRPRVVFLEWLQPFYVGGHWVPEMINMAGGCDVFGKPATPSFRVTAEEIIAASPDYLFVAPCGYDAAKAAGEYIAMELPPEWREIPAVKNGKVFALEANSYFSRPGPRLITGVEALAKILHPSVQVNEEAERAGTHIPSIKASRLAASF